MLTTPVPAGTKLAGVRNASNEEVQSSRLVTGANGDTPVSADAPLPVTDEAVAAALETLAAAIGAGSGGGTIGGATEATLATVSSLLAALGANTDTLEALATSTNTALAQLNGFNDGIEGLITATNAAVGAGNASLAALVSQTDGLEGLQATSNSLLTALGGYSDNVESLIGATNTSLGALQGYVDGLEAAAAAQTAALATVGTRAYAAPSARLAAGATDAATTGLAATEVLLHASTRCFVRAGAVATVDAIPLEAGEKFHMRLASGQQIHVIRDTVDGFLNIVPVA
jgi:ABC-type transporter Mla subunit MlaD